MKKLAVLFSLILLCSSTKVFAANDMLDASYNFNKAKKILVIIQPTTFSDDLPLGTLTYELQKYAKNNDFKMTNQTMFDTLLEFGHEEAYLDLLATKASQSNTLAGQRFFSTQMDLYYSKYWEERFDFDLIISTTIYRYDTGTVFKPGYTYTTTEYREIYIENEQGTTTIKIPVDKEVIVPDEYWPTLHAHVGFSVYDTKTGKIVWSREDDRSKEANVFGHQDPSSMYERIVKDFFKELKKKLTKK